MKEVFVIEYSGRKYMAMHTSVGYKCCCRYCDCGENTCNGKEIGWLIYILQNGILVLCNGSVLLFDH